MKLSANMKRRAVLFFLSIMLIGSAFLRQDTYAYLISEDCKTNEFSIGYTEGEVVEIFPDNKATTDSEIEKIVDVVNGGNLPAFVRVRIVFSESAAKDIATICGVDSSLWEYDPESDFYYCKEFIDVGESVRFMDSVRFDEVKDVDDFNITVYAELFHHENHKGLCAEREYYDAWYPKDVLSG